MSNLTTTLYANNLVDEGLLVDALEKKVEELAKLLESKKPVCPICKTEMSPFNFKGYYDEFSGWSCECKNFPDTKSCQGAYA
jgi:tRNA(Ile2) C34 agmatinyltransferase TiaS